MSTSSPQNYTLGRGEVYFGKFADGTTTPTGERYLGNTPEFSLTIDVENLDHYSSDRGIREKDDSVVLQADRSGSLTTDSVRPDNIALFFFGTKDTVTVVSATAQSQTYTGSPAGLAVQLGTSTANPSGARNVSNVTMVTVPPTPALAEGTDYVVGLVRGRVMFEETENVKALTSVDFTFDVGASKRDRIMSGSQPVEGALRYIAQNPKGQNFDYFMPWVKLTPNGDYALKGDEWQTIPFSIEILKKPGLEAIYCDGQPFAVGP